MNPTDSSMDDPDVSDDAAEEVWAEPRLRGHRSPHDRYVAGVLGGLGERFSIDPLFLRLAVVALAVAFRDGPVVLIPLVYAAAWIAVPVVERRSLAGSIRTRASLQEAVGALVAAALCGLLLSVDDLWVAAILAIVAWALLDRPLSADSVAHERPVMPIPNPAPTPGSASDLDTNGLRAAWGRSRRGVAGPLHTLRTRPERIARPRREPALWPLTCALLAALAVVFFVIDRSTTPGADPRIFVNLALIAVGAVVVVSGWRGRAGWTLLLILPLIPMWIGFSAADIGRFSGSGTSTQIISSLPESGRADIEHGYGDIRVHITEDAVSPGDTLQVTTNLTAGSTWVEVPRNVRLVVRNRFGIGTAHIHNNYWSNQTTLIDGARTRTFAAMAPACRQHEGLYQNFLNVYPHVATRIREAGGLLPDDVIAELEEDQVPVPEVVSISNAGDVVWLVSFDDFGDLCTPEEPPTNPGTIELDATIGLGGLTVVRTH